jgi:tetratricopeptide (TPR) repeat protein
MQDILADNLFSLSALSIQTNDVKMQNMAYARDHFDIRMKLRDGSQFAEDRLATAEGELGQLCMLRGQYEDSIEHCNIAIEITNKSPRFLLGDDWPTWSHCTQAFSLSALGRYDEAVKLMLATEKYHLGRQRQHPGHSFQ